MSIEITSASAASAPLRASHRPSFMASARATARRALTFTFVSLGVASAGGAGNALADPTDLSAESVVVRGCEAWIDKAVAESVAMHPELGTIWHSRIYLKIDERAIPLDSIARVGWLGRERTYHAGQLDRETDWRERGLAPFEPSARDYFVLDLGNLATQYPDLRDPKPFRVAHEGAFFIETVEGRRLWLNENRTSYDTWSFDLSFEKFLKRERQTLGSVGVAAFNSLDQARRTADFSAWLNPGSCR